MGDDKQIICICEACKEEIEPIKINGSKKGAELYSCPSCNAVLHIEKVIEFEPDINLNRTLHCLFP